MEFTNISDVARRLQALPAHAVYAQLTGREDWGKKMQELVPSHMHSGFVYWVAGGDETMLGDFMRALVSNDLMGAYGRADDYNARAIPDWVRFLYNYSPSGCYGSVEKVKDWPGLLPREEV